jgi:glyoxylase-like metal-dependent hydrolase (beta-lactamase superfamily II)
MASAAASAATWRGGELPPAQLKDLLREGQATLLDVRDAEEVEAWPIPGALHVPLDDLPGGARDLPTEGPLVAVCARGRRSAEAARLLAGRGHQVASLEGGLQAWSTTYDAAEVPLPQGRVVQLRRLGKGCLTYIVEGEEGTAVIDPTCHLEAVVEALRGRRVAHVLDTHRHADHVSGAYELARATGAKLHLSANDGYALRGGDGPDRVEGGDVVALGARGGLDLEVAHTPGHTPGSLTFLLDGQCAFTGDALFLDGVARPDLRDAPEEHARDLFQTYQRIAAWPRDLAVLPAHLSARWPYRIGEPAVLELGEVRRRVGAFDLGLDAFLERVLGDLPPKPENAARILELNEDPSEGCDPETLDELEAGGNRCVA